MASAGCLLCEGPVISVCSFGHHKAASTMLNVQKGGFRGRGARWGEENESRLLGRKKESVGGHVGISLISLSSTLKGYIIRARQSSVCTSPPPHCLTLPVLSITLTQLISDFLFLELHNGILRNLHPLLVPPSSSFSSSPTLLPSIFVLDSLLSSPPLHPPSPPPPPSWRCPHCLSLSTSLYLITPREPPCCDPGHQ